MSYFAYKVLLFEQTNGQTNKRTEKRTNGQTIEQTDTQSNGHTDTRTDKQTDGRSYKNPKVIQ